MRKHKNRKILRAIMRAIVPEGGVFNASADDHDLIPIAEKFFKSLNPAIRVGFPFLLGYIQINSILYTGRPFTWLSPEKAGKYLTKFEESNFYHKRIIILALKMVTLISFYDVDANVKQIGYDHLSEFRGDKKND